MRLTSKAAALSGVTALLMCLGTAAGATVSFRGNLRLHPQLHRHRGVCRCALGLRCLRPRRARVRFFQVLFDSEGNFVEAIVHNNYDATITANGKTITERDTWTSFFYPDGSRDVGLTVHIQGPGGIVVRDAGQIVRDSDGNVLYTRGPHEQLSGVSFCPALAP